MVVKLLKLFAIMLELPDEDQLVRQHEYDVKGEDHLRYMYYAARSPEENEQIGNLYSAGHTDLGSITLLFRQPIAALQIQNSSTGQWKWVKPAPESITINICDALSAVSGPNSRSSSFQDARPSLDYFEEVKLSADPPLSADDRRLFEVICTSRSHSTS